MRVKIYISGMDDSHSVERVRSAIKSVEGVCFATVDFKAGNATVETYDNLMQVDIANAVQEAGYEVLGYVMLA